MGKVGGAILLESCGANTIAGFVDALRSADVIDTGCVTWSCVKCELTQFRFWLWAEKNPRSVRVEKSKRVEDRIVGEWAALVRVGRPVTW